VTYLILIAIAAALYWRHLLVGANRKIDLQARRIADLEALVSPPDHAYTVAIIPRPPGYGGADVAVVDGSTVIARGDPAHLEGTLVEAVAFGHADPKRIPRGLRWSVACRLRGMSAPVGSAQAEHLAQALREIGEVTPT